MLADAPDSLQNRTRLWRRIFQGVYLLLSTALTAWVFFSLLAVYCDF